ncbi:MAG: type II secretion system F family protein, partial [Actinomycetes bacterium]
DLKRLVLAIELGSTLPLQLDAWARRAQSRHVSELCTKLRLALDRGTPLAEMLTELSTSLRSEVQQVLSKKAGQNETRMLVPLIFLILPITVLFAIYPSLQVLSITQ